MLDQPKSRPLARADLHALEVVLERSELFPAELLHEMAKPYLGGSPDHLWR